MNVLHSSQREDEISWWGLGLVAFKLLLGLLMLFQIPVSTIIAIALIGGAASIVLSLIVKTRSKQDSDAGETVTEATVEASKAKRLQDTTPVSSQHAEPQRAAPNASVTCAAAGWWWTTDWPANDGRYPII